jgi:predicted alpha-1,6-mannanase (GH76 family)
MQPQWANRAASAETAITARHFARPYGMPGAQLGVVSWPRSQQGKRFTPWHFWWQAHLLDCLIDAQLRDPHPQRQKRIAAQVRGHLLRNHLRWTNDYYDDMAWIALALERADRLVGIQRRRALRTLTRQFTDVFVPEVGAIPWRKRDNFFNSPANGPAGIFLARTGELHEAQLIADWIDETLIDPDTHLVFDGIRDGTVEKRLYTYCQGVVLGLETELAARTTDERHQARVQRLVAALAQHMSPGGVLKGAGGGDGGLFSGITIRYLALVATKLPGDTPENVAARDTARKLVLTSAQSAWEYRQTVNGLPLFGSDWDQAAQVPSASGAAARFVGGAVSSSEVPERDLSVQLSGWMLMEAAAYTL